MKTARTVLLPMIMATVLVLGAVPAVAGPAAPGAALAMSFAPDTIGPGSTTRAAATITNTGDTGLTGLSLTVTFPAGVTVQTPGSPSSTCTFATVDAAPGGTALTMAGARLGIGAACTVEVDVTSSTVGVTTTNASLTSDAAAPAATTAALTVTEDLPGFTASFSPATIDQGEESRLTLTVDNTLNPADVTFLQITDELPAGLVVADRPAVFTDCGTSVLQVEVDAQPRTSVIAMRAQGSPGFPVVPANDICTLSVDVTAARPVATPNRTDQLTVTVSATTSSVGFAVAPITAVTRPFRIAALGNPVQPGGVAIVRVSIENTTGAEITGGAFTADLDAFRAGTTVASVPAGTPCGTGSTVSAVGSASLDLNGATLAPGTSCSFDVGLQLPGGETVASTLALVTSLFTATVAADGADGRDGSGVLPYPAASDEVVIGYGLTVASAFPGDPVPGGDVATAQFTVTNDDPGTALQDIAFTDDLEAFIPGLVPSGALPPACGGGSISFFQGVLSVTGIDLPAGGTCSFDVDLGVPERAPGGLFVNRIAGVTAQTDPVTDLRYGTGLSSTLQVIGAPDLSIAVADDALVPGGQATMTLKLRHGDLDGTLPSAQDVAVSIDLGATLTGLVADRVVSDSTCRTGGIRTSLSADRTVLALSALTLASGATCTVDVTLRTPASAAPGTYTITSNLVTATVGGQAVEGVAAEGDLRIQGLLPSKAFTDDPVDAGEQVTLSYTLRNATTDRDFSSITLQENLSETIPGLVVTDTTTRTEVCGPGSQVFVLSGGARLVLIGGSLPADTSCTVALQLTVPTGVAADLYASVSEPVTYDGADGPFTGPAAVDILTVGAAEPLTPPPPPVTPPSGTEGSSADLSLTVTPSTETVGAGEDVGLTFTVTNDGPAASDGVLALDLPDSVLVSGLNGCTPVGTANDCAVPTIAAGGSADVTLTTTHPVEGLDEIIGQIRGTATDPVIGNNVATAAITVGLAPSSEELITAAISVSGERFPDGTSFAGTSATSVVLARVDEFADALTGTVLTGQAPLLFTPSLRLDARTGEEIQRVLGAAGTVYLLGGEAALSADIEQVLADAGHRVVRLAGPSRVETALAVADEARLTSDAQDIGLARAFGTPGNPTAAWADSVTAGGWAAATGTPILLTATDALHPAVAEWLDTNLLGGTVTILGGVAAIDQTVAEQVGPATRVSGPERGSTAVAVARQLRGVQPDGPRSYLLTNGFAPTGWGHGLLAAGLSADSGAPVLLTDTDTAPAPTVDEVSGCADQRVSLRRVAPANQLSDDLVAQLDGLDDGPCAS